MTHTQLAQMAISAVIRSKEQLDIFTLNNVLCGKETKAVKDNGFSTIKTFGAGKKYPTRVWHYLFIQMIQQDIFTIEYDNQCKLHVTTKGEQIIKGELEVSFIMPYIANLRFTRQGVICEVEFDIQDAIDWKALTALVGKDIYWNYQQERRVDVNSIIPTDIPNREAVKAKFLEIIQQAYKIPIEGDIMIYPKKVDMDIYGHEVLPLSGTFEECLDKLKQFVIKMKRYPQMHALTEETALRKWFREVGHGLIPTTPEQMSAFRAFIAEYPLNKYK